ncbi:hypothetical protein HOY80DRAFT_1028335 [Tuber brumale]|nr:hypothetical protein HOY80DRAFT_1028335 [Tuber brumale]
MTSNIHEEPIFVDLDPATTSELPSESEVAFTTTDQSPPSSTRARAKVEKWAEVSSSMVAMKPQPISRSPESCRQRVKMLVEIYKKAELASLRKSGTDEEFGEFELNMVELATEWDQASTDPVIRKLAQLKAAQLELDGKKVQEDTMRGLVRRREEELGGSSRSDGSAVSTQVPAKKKQKNRAVKDVDSLLLGFAEGMENDKEELKEIEKREDQKHEDFLQRILGLTEEIREHSERRSHDAFLEKEARKEELVLILEALRKDNEI